MNSSSGHSAWRYYYPSQPDVPIAPARRIPLISRLADLIFLSGALLFAYQVYGLIGHDEWTRYPSIVLLKYLPAGWLRTLDSAGVFKEWLFWLMERADISVLLVVMGFLIAKFVSESE